MNKTPFLLAAILLSVAVLPASARESIVGEWRFEDGTCTPADGMLVIGAKSIGGDTLSCDFDTVGRQGDTVTWKGQCGFPEPMKPATVIARLKGKRLNVAFNGGDNGPYVRCTGS